MCQCYRQESHHVYMCQGYRQESHHVYMCQGYRCCFCFNNYLLY
jgi:hypothetical protein